MVQMTLSSTKGSAARWQPGTAPVAVVMISRNEAHNMEAVLANIRGWAQEVFLVDSHSSDDTVDIALRNGVHVVQRPFRGFGDQWNYAVQELPITAFWTMKLDPDERISNQLKQSIQEAVKSSHADGLTLYRRLWFMGKRLPVGQYILRVWRTGSCRFTNVSVNEHPRVDGHIVRLAGELEHHDSPDLEHWLDKQNRYTTAEAIAAHRGTQLADEPRLFGTAFQRRMWIKRHLWHIPLRYSLLFAYNYFVLGACRAGWVGYAWSRLRSDVYRLREYKFREIRLTGRLPREISRATGKPDRRVPQHD